MKPDEVEPTGANRDDRIAAPSDEGSEPSSTPPPQAVAVFGDQIGLAQRYWQHLATTGVEWGLIGPREVPRLWERHLINCALPLPLVPQGASVVDVGSGAGLPGLVWAVARPDLQVTLVEPLLRRATWLEQVAADLELSVRVVRARAEDVPKQAPDAVGAAVVTARAVAPLGKLARWTVPLVAPDGVVLAMKGSSAPEELARDERVLRKLKVRGEVVQCGSDDLGRATVVRLSKSR